MNTTTNINGLRHYGHKNIIKGALILSLILSLIGGVSAATLYCGSCTNCTTTINSATNGDIVKLTQNISTTGTCISFENNNRTFDCQGYTIDGDGGAPGWHFGIYLNGK